MTKNEFMNSILIEIGSYYNECENSILKEIEEKEVIETARDFPRSYINSDENL